MGTVQSTVRRYFKSNTLLIFLFDCLSSTASFIVIELGAVMESLGQSADAKDIAAMVKEFDTDGNGVIDCEYLL